MFFLNLKHWFKISFTLMLYLQLHIYSISKQRTDGIAEIKYSVVWINSKKFKAKYEFKNNNLTTYFTVKLRILCNCVKFIIISVTF